MKKFMLIIALLLPVLVPTFAVSKILFERSTAPVYQIKIQGYDPRDMLYGHYLTFRFVEKDIQAQTDLSIKAKDNIRQLDRRYYIPEREARYIDEILRRNSLEMKIGVGVLKNDNVFIDQLYIDGRSMEEYLKQTSF